VVTEVNDVISSTVLLQTNTNMYLDIMRQTRTSTFILCIIYKNCNHFI